MRLLPSVSTFLLIRLNNTYLGEKKMKVELQDNARRRKGGGGGGATGGEEHAFRRS